MAEKKCRYCATMIPAEAKICPNCRKKQGTSWIVYVIVGLFAFYAIGKLSGPPSKSSTTNYSPHSVERETAGPLLELQTWRWGENYSFATAEGTVKNISGRSLEHVEAVVQFYDKSGNFITSADALISYDPILPNQISPFRVSASYNPQMKRARVEFKHLMGGTIEHTQKAK